MPIGSDVGGEGPGFGIVPSRYPTTPLISATI